MIVSEIRRNVDVNVSCEKRETVRVQGTFKRVRVRPEGECESAGSSMQAIKDGNYDILTKNFNKVREVYM